MTAAAPYVFAPPFQTPATSPIRALLPYANRPGTVSFAGGYPAPELFDVEGLAAASDHINRELVQHLQYSGTEGQASLRRELAALSASRGIACNPDTELMVTGGSQQALALLAQVMLGPGDTVIIENPGFPTSVQALRHTQATVHTVPSGPDGIDVDALEQQVQTLRPRMVCVVATFSNPGGATLSRARRERLLALAARHQFLLVEDDPYGELRFAGEAVPPLVGLAQGEQRHWVAYLSSLSKTVAPALRIGWLVAPPEIRRRCLSAKQADDLSVSPWIQEIAARYLANGSYQRHLPRIIAAYRARCTTMAQALTRDLGDRVTFSAPEGGMFFWVRLNDGLNATALLPYAVAREVVYVPGSAFSPDPALADPHALRLSFASTDEAQVALGIARLADAVRAYAAGEPAPPLPT